MYQVPGVSAAGIVGKVPGVGHTSPSVKTGSVSVAGYSVVATVGNGGRVVGGTFLSNAHLSVLLPRSSVQVNELLASLPSLKMMTA